MNTKTVNIKTALRTAVIPLAVSLSFFTLSVEAANTAKITKGTHLAAKLADSKKDLKNLTHKQIIKEAADAFKATGTALKALENDQPKQALAALQVASGNLHLLIARDPALGLIPIDIQVQIFEGITDLKTIKRLEDELDDLIDDNHYQAARPIVDSLVDELRVTTAYLPLATYPVAIDQVAPLVDAGKIEEAKQVLIDVLDTYVSEQEITPLAIMRAESELTLAFQLQDKGNISKQETKNKIKKLVKNAENHIKVAEALGYGTKDDYEPLYDSIDKLKKTVGTYGFKGEWIKIKKSLSSFKNKIVHPAG